MTPTELTALCEGYAAQAEIEEMASALVAATLDHKGAERVVNSLQRKPEPIREVHKKDAMPAFFEYRRPGTRLVHPVKRYRMYGEL